MSDYSAEIADALADIKAAGVQKRIQLHVSGTGADPNARWIRTGDSVENWDAWMLVLPVNEAPQALQSEMFEKGTNHEKQYRYLLVAGEGRTQHPDSRAVVLDIEGKNGNVKGVAPLTVSDSGAIIYHMVVEI